MLPDRGSNPGLSLLIPHALQVDSLHFEPSEKALVKVVTLNVSIVKAHFFFSILLKTESIMLITSYNLVIWINELQLIQAIPFLVEIQFVAISFAIEISQ